MHDVNRVRRFNRAVTRYVGALDGDFPGRQRSPGACRVLFEIGHEAREIRELRHRLGLDSGYLSRLVRSLTDQGLVAVEPSGADARVRLLNLTDAGREELSGLERLSSDRAAALMAGLAPARRDAVLQAMQTIADVLDASRVAIAVENPTSPAARGCLDRYFMELSRRFAGGFDRGQSIPAEPEALTPPGGYFLVARLDGRPVGCGALKCHPGFAEIKRMWVDDDARGLGLGRQILGHLEALAGVRGIALLRLETNGSLVEARRLYRGAGYVEVPRFNDEPYAHHWFEKRLTPGA